MQFIQGNLETIGKGNRSIYHKVTRDHISAKIIGIVELRQFRENGASKRKSFTLGIKMFRGNKLIG